MIVPIAVVIYLIAYLYGSFSSARVIAKSFRALNIYKVGSGLADTENIYTNISKSMGVLVAALDLCKAYLFLLLIEFILRLIDKQLPIMDISILYSPNLMLIYGIGMLMGHCLPFTHHFRGGRGIFTYMGFFAYFAFLPMFITVVLAWVLVVRFRQIRFAQFTIVILPVILFQFFFYLTDWYKPHLPTYFNSILIVNALLMGVLNYFVSKRLGEI
ncbi:MAG: glycerol-3-phosphate acyltransferase [Candidatus Cloacimonetes bacterium]|jgi:glycerol-3-phosphate acyltransferase PlsY|nr:glycerol-3-phosphate acyltransferase [Candidatus Cloacimonadota bacterium]MDY0298275.1 glycerol-3-phosphate acyltransferase [Candidatus Cloacimonadaceae bacterium]MCB5278734.1 glycerol-3-phosphate acyltransferase [Candidatus Cloacimonadota bacterium]MCK9332104.1 glycerol-3-phosphate acyltransferase [Candidatus Cloacimonadota bacterium]MDD2209801.1 glycerol-3-phosphate acyltransferase [Candidatus Cloacimonadota bacterium]